MSAIIKEMSEEIHELRCENIKAATHASRHAWSARPVRSTAFGQQKDWRGGPCPEHPDSQITPIYRGPARPNMTRITCAPASRLHWSHDGGDDDIVSYVVNFDASKVPPTRPEGE